MQIVKLDPERKALLVAALRSGEYQQGRGRLYDGIEGGYCCYGVACVLAGAEKQFRDGRFFFGDHTASSKPSNLCRFDYLPKGVSAWLGILETASDYRDGRIYIQVHDTDPADLKMMRPPGMDYVTLDALNDAVDDYGKHRFPFERIADLIEERL